MPAGKENRGTFGYNPRNWHFQSETCQRMTQHWVSRQTPIQAHIACSHAILCLLSPECSSGYLLFTYFLFKRFFLWSRSSLNHSSLNRRMKRWKERTEGGGGRSGGGGRGFSSRSDRCDCYCGYTHKQPSWVICSAMYKQKDTSAHLYLIISHREHTGQGREPGAVIKPNNTAAERCTNTHMHIKQNYNGWNGLLLYPLVKGEALYKPGVLRPNTLCVCIHMSVSSWDIAC